MNRKTFLQSIAGIAVIGSIVTGLVGCSKKITTKTSTTITGLSMRLACLAKFPRAYVVIADDQYITPDIQWLKGEFYAKFKSDLFDRGVTKWDKRFDCDKFARYFADLLQMSFFIENFHSNGKAQSVSVGEVYYKVGGISGHAINLFYDGTSFTFFEPQTGKEVFLTDVELQSIFFIHF